ncbi:MAG: ubiquinol-cytochrome C chaperone family protein [Kordiimonas sp.]
MFKFFRARRAEKQIAYSLYTKLVEQARHPAFYSEYDVEDSIEGRFDMILLHLFLVDDRLEQAGEQYTGLRRNMHEAMVTDLDRSFREIGVGDMSVGKEMKKVGNAWLGRHTAYAAAFTAVEAGDALTEALAKNVYGGDENVPADKLALYMLKARKLLALADTETLVEGKIVFPVPSLAEIEKTNNEKAVS